MALMKHALDMFLRYVLRRRTPENGDRQPGNIIDGDQPSTVTLRTFPAGGDPFDDMIEFSLRNGPGVPSGFREPE